MVRFPHYFPLTNGFSLIRHFVLIRFSDRVEPWVHYVPVQLDYSDLYSTMMFFAGDFSGRLGHDDLAKRIASAGKAWTEKYWRQEDMTAYMFRYVFIKLNFSLRCVCFSVSVRARRTHPVSSFPPRPGSKRSSRFVSLLALGIFGVGARRALSFFRLPLECWCVVT